MRAMSAFILEWGISAVSCFAICALRILVRKSAMGSLTDIAHLPTRFRYPGDLTLVGELPETDPAQPELPVVPVRPTAPLAPAVLPDREFLLSLLLYQQGLSGHTQPLNCP